MDYARRKPNHEVSPLTIAIMRYSTGSVGAPFDIHTGMTDRIWFTGAANAVGHLNNERKLAIFPRGNGVRPCFMTEGSYDPTNGGNWIRGIWFSDPDGGRVGFVDWNGKFMPEVELGTASAPRAFAETTFYPLVTTNLGRLIELPSLKERVVKQKAIDAVGFGPWQTLWYSADGSLYCIHPYEGEFRFELPERRDIRELVRGGDSLYYCDERRDVLGLITDGHRPGDTRLIEFDLPPGTAPRAVCDGLHGPWFTGRDGKSLFRIEYRRTLTEYRCTNATADLARLKWNGEEMWFTEPRHASVSVASLSGF